MKSVGEAVGFLIQLALMVILGAIAISTIRGCSDVVILSEAERPRMAVQYPEPPLAIADQDRALLARLLPHIRQTAREEIEAEFKKAADDLDSADAKTGQRNAGGFASAFAAAVSWFVQKAIRALFWSLFLAAVAAVFYAYWMYPVGFVACWTALFAFLTKLIARREAVKAVAESKPATPAPNLIRLDGR